MKDPQDLQNTVLVSFLTELRALKPGNVSLYADGHGMQAEDFRKSAQLTTPILCESSLSIGERILESVKITISEIGCNTNLGMLLLFAPLIRAVELNPSLSPENLQKILQGLTKQDTRCIFQAIRHANPGGLGDSKYYDVNKKNQPSTTIQKAMQEASQRDLIAKQYATNFTDIFSLGLQQIEKYFARWQNIEWATVACYMEFMSQHPDSHISRKFGNPLAEQIKKDALPIAKELQKKDNPTDAIEMLMAFDLSLKNIGANPGSNADLTAASVLAYHLNLLCNPMISRKI